MALEVVQLEITQEEEKARPAGIAVNPFNGEIAIADLSNDRILFYNGRRNFLREFGRRGRGRLEFHQPFGVAYTSGGMVVVTEQMNHRIQMFDTATGEVLKCFGREGTGDREFQSPLGVSVDSNGRIIVCDGLNNHRMQVFDSQLNHLLLQFPVTRAPGDTKDPLPYWCLFHGNKFFVTDYNNCCIKVYSDSGEFVNKIELGQEVGIQPHGPRGLCVDGIRNNLIVCDHGNRIKIFTLDGEIVGRSTESIPDSYQATKCLDGRIVVTRYEEGSLLFPLIEYFQ